MYIPLVYEHLFYKYLVRRSVGQATKGKRASLLMDVVILVVLFPTFKTRLQLVFIVIGNDRKETCEHIYITNTNTILKFPGGCCRSQRLNV